jgi:hypothetical protein
LIDPHGAALPEVRANADPTRNFAGFRTTRQSPHGAGLDCVWRLANRPPESLQALLFLQGIYKHAPRLRGFVRMQLEIVFIISTSLHLQEICSKISPEG